MPSAYWCGQAAVDIPFCYLILFCMTAVLFSLHTEDMLTSSNVTAVVRTAVDHLCSGLLNRVLLKRSNR